MQTIEMPRHAEDVDLTWEQVRDALRALEGSRVNVRVVERSDPEVLVAVLEGTLGALSHSKDPTLFWPVRRAGDHHEHVEDVGFYLRPNRFDGAVGRAGCTVLVVIQGPVIVNIRRT
jgi:hypothetical protein